MTLKKVIAFIILVPVAVVAVLFMVANRAIVTLTLNPFHPGDAAFSFTAPFFIWLFAFLIAGVVIGGISVWINQSKYRKALREREDEVAKLRHNAEARALSPR